MNSRERLTRAMQGRDVDYLPCSIYFNDNLQVNGQKLKSWEEHCKLAVELGTDPFVPVGIAGNPHPDVKTESHIEHISGEEFPVLRQSWQTPAGELTQAVRLTEDIKDWTRIHWGDHSASNVCKPLIESADDVAKVKYLISPATETDYRQSVAINEKAFSLAGKYQAPTLLTCGQGLADLMFMMGAENLILFAIDNPDAFDELARFLHEKTMRKIELAKRMGIDILKRFGGYEMTNFFSPGIFERTVMPYLKKEVERAHELDMIIYYRVVTGMEPLLGQIASIGFDCIEGGEPHLSKCSLQNWHDAFSGKASSWTGISTPVILGGDSTEKVREEVRKTVDIFGRKNFILGVTNSVRNHFPWKNTLAMVDEWKKVRL
ncbi:MAG: uroporphyrinogen decarboxylase family protein [Victivallaceae bacterium]|nr:uroporphyrinogen decarboxylase family protein [Victivallaceae bacterium]